jgi:flavin-binding protein dodecin
MADQTYDVVEIVGVSGDTVSQAVRNALKRASQTLRNLDWFKVKGIRGAVNNNSEPVFQVHIELGFRLEDKS